ncbi:SDR family oxidoreductase [Candidatus Pelagibacter sp.]|uniref:SDR family oxidoreductase n=1 Tax=Candidatus Pelagibacter sp. TaxID=2024849 RepID=UPI003F8363B3
MKNIIIIGSNGLIGKALAKGLSKKYRVIEVDILNLKKQNYFQCNILNEIEVKKVFSKIFKKYKKIDCLINSAYPRKKNFSKKFLEINLNDFNQNLSINVGSLYCLIKNIFPYFKKIKKGNIINIASIYGKIQPKFDIYEKTPINPPTVYGPIKSAQIMMINYFAKIFAYKKINIRCNTISPGGVYGGQSKKFLNNYKKYCKSIGMISPNDLVGVADFLISEKSLFITGQDIQVDDGFSI